MAEMTERPAVKALVQRLRHTAYPRRWLLATVDSVMWVLALPLGYLLRYELELEPLEVGGLLGMMAAAVVLNLTLGRFGGQYAGRWRVGSIDEAVGLSVLVVQVTAFLLAATFVFDRPLPVGAVLIAGVVALLGISVTRVSWRLLAETVDSTVSSRRMLVFGAGDAAAQVITAILTDPASTFRPVALVDDDPTKARRSIRGVKVEGTRENLLAVAQRHQAEVLLIAAPGADSATIRELSALGVAADLEVLVLPPASQLYGTLGVADIRSVTEEDLLGRRPVQTDLHLIAGYLTGRTVLVTGAGGSIGSELCTQLDALKPARLVMLDRDESALHAVQLSLTGRAMLDAEELVVADIRDRDRLREVFERWRPDVVFHAAALKHLSLLEMHPEEGVKTNIEGTLNVLEASAEVGVGRFVNISTDKAADPTSVLGYTKRIAERLTSYVGTKHDGTYLSVRFGNVLGSRGSVLTAFRRQIEVGGPLTVTHEDITRYFMTVEEAVQLVVQAGAIGSDGEAMVLDMGTPVRIDDVARRMIEAADRPVEICYTGMRPGEKLHEVLLGEDEPDVRPAHPLISHAPVPPLDPLELQFLLNGSRDDLDVMVSLCANRARRWSPELCDNEPVPEVVDLTDAAQAPIRIRLAQPSLGEEELDAVRGVFESGVLTNGPKTAEFEQAFARRHEVEHAVAVANGTIALQAMFRALGIGPGDEVIVPSLTFISSATAVTHVGATPVWADVDPETLNIDPVQAVRLITPRTKAVLAVHYGGQPADMWALSEICDSHRILLLEDAAEAHGARYDGRSVGGFGKAGMFSFTPTKNITTGEGGVITTDDGDLARRLRTLRNHGQTALYHHEIIGYNWRMTEMQAAIGCVQLGKLDSILDRKRTNAAWMSERLADVPGVSAPVARPDREHTYMLYTVQLERGRERVLSCLLRAGIEARIYFPPAHRQPAYRDLDAKLPVTERVASRILSIPMHAGLTSEDLEEIAGVIETATEGMHERRRGRTVKQS
jgi:FlaA1/EpsC-like NDP-sugar epimerase/dTDP-4-amino-4,6-dideoxygalactose transaminase